jgi:hypothetical protein
MDKKMKAYLNMLERQFPYPRMRIEDWMFKIKPPKAKGKGRNKGKKHWER